MKLEQIALAAKKTDPHSVFTGNEILKVSRIPFGIFPLDLATGGGIPGGRVSVVYGQESSGKTNVALKAIASAQEIYPDKACAFIDVEGTYDNEWATALGVDTSKLLVFNPVTAEEAADVLQDVASAEDLSLAVLDSVGSMTPFKAEENDSEVQQVGGNAKVVTRMMNKLIASIARQRKEGRYPSILLLNQVRFKIGAMGDPEYMPGGKALQHGSSLTIRLYSKPVVQKDINPKLPYKLDTKVTIKKHKVPIVAKSAEYEIYLINNQDHGVVAGYVPEWKMLKECLVRFNLVGKEEDGTYFAYANGDTKVSFDKQKDMFSAIQESKEWFNYLKSLATEICLVRGF